MITPDRPAPVLGDRPPPGSALRGRPFGRRADEAGGAVSLWVVLMVPVSAFAAVVAMAGPQRMAAESSVDEAADDLATMAVAWRDGQSTEAGALPAFPPECSTEHQQTRFDTDIVNHQLARERYQVEIDELPQDFPADELARLQEARDEELVQEESRIKARESVLEEWGDACKLLFKWIVRDLGGLGVALGSLEGFYSDSLAEVASLDPLDSPDQMALPCKISERVEVRDAVHVALAADWVHAGWAAAQVWPDGSRMAAESIGRRRRNVTVTDLDALCGDYLNVVDTRGQPVALMDPGAESRRVSQAVPGRVVFDG